MRKLAVALSVGALLAVGNAGAAHGSPSCWGQASAVFAQMGEMGEHSASQATPRLGLRNLARALADAGAIPDDSMASLGAFVATELGLSIDACSG
jgi:hypothetical protein